MIHFQVLGALDLRRESGERIGSLLAHPKRVGMLLHLALDQPGRPVERSLLASRFWPDSPELRAQASFRNALSQMRRGLGDGAIDADGQQVWLNPNGLTCDAVQLQAAVDTGRWREAAALATGELAPGFELDEKLDFQRWLEAERERLRRAALTGLRARADELVEADPVEADRLLERASVLAPFDGSLLEQRLELCERRGDRTEAVALFHAWSTTLRHELDLEPSPETVAVYERVTGPMAPRIDTRPATSPLTSAPEPTPPPRPASVAMPSAPVQAAPMSDREPIRTRRTLYLKAAVVTLLVVAGGLAVVLRPSTAAGPAPMPDARAVALIEAGMAQYWSGDEAAALESFRDAADIDPGVPRAHYGLMLASRALVRRGPLEEAARALARLRPRMTPAELGRVDAFMAYPDTARTLYQALIAQEPDSLDLVFELADLEFHWGSSWGVPREDVRAKFERIEAGGYAEVRALRHLIRLDGADGDLDAVRRRTARLRELGAPALDILTGQTVESILDPAMPLDVSALVGHSFEQRNSVVGAVAAVPTQPDRVDQFLADLHAAVPASAKVEMAVWNALAAAGRGRLQRAEEWLRTAGEGSPARADEFRAVVATLPWLPADAGRWVVAARMLAARRTTLLISPFAGDFMADAIYAPRATFLDYLTALPETGSAPWDHFDALEQKTVIDLALQAAYRRILEGRRLIIAEDSEERGLEALGEPAIAPDRQYPWLLHHPFAVERYLRVQALVLAGRFEEARGFLRGWPDPAGYDRAYLSWALTLGGDVAGQRGAWDEAEREYRRAAEMLRGADPAFQTLQDHIQRQLNLVVRRRDVTGS